MHRDLFFTFKEVNPQRHTRLGISTASFSYVFVRTDVSFLRCISNSISFCWVLFIIALAFKEVRKCQWLENLIIKKKTFFYAGT